MSGYGYLRALKIIYIGMLFGQMILITISILIKLQLTLVEESKELSKILLPIVAVFIISSIIISNYISKKRIVEARKFVVLTEKLVAYRSMVIIRLALLEAPSIFTIVCYIVTGNTSFIFFAILIIVVFVMNNPTKEKIIFELELNREEQDALNNI